MKEFSEILKIYCGERAIALDLQEEDKYRGCRIWTFRRSVKKWRWKANGYFNFKKTGTTVWNWKDIPERDKESYINEFWMALTNYELEFEEDCEHIFSSENREMAKYRLQYEIDRQYSLQTQLDDIL